MVNSEQVAEVAGVASWHDMYITQPPTPIVTDQWDMVAHMPTLGICDTPYTIREFLGSGKVD